MFRLFILTIMIGFLTACGSSHVVKPPQDPLALQEIQTREFEAGDKIVFASVLTVLQDVGYIVESADGVSGLITAKSPTQSDSTFSLFYGWGKKNQTTRVTAFVEPIGEKITKVRFNFVGIVGDSKGYGINSQVDTPIEDPKIYENTFERVAEAIFIRQATVTNS